MSQCAMVTPENEVRETVYSPAGVVIFWKYLYVSFQSIIISSVDGAPNKEQTGDGVDRNFAKHGQIVFWLVIEQIAKIHQFFS